MTLPNQQLTIGFKNVETKDLLLIEEIKNTLHALGGY
jgi:hypothetical protein